MVIAVGNLSAGGTGKSPMVEYLIRLLHSKFSLATLSRGYKRKSKGFLIANEYTGVDEIGDEPFQMYLKYGKVAKITVGEERSIAIPNILLEHPETQVVIMDDGFQHRTVRPDYSILLTDYAHLFYNDHLLPWGRLREAKVGAKRAHSIIVSKCPSTLDDAEMAEIKSKIWRYAGKNMPIYFSRILYSKVKSLVGNISQPTKVIAFAGLANSEPFIDYINTNYEMVEMVAFKDHHHYTEGDILDLAEKARAADASLITTEKDVVKFRDKSKIKLLEGVALNYFSIEHQFIKDGNIFDKMVQDAISDKYTEEE